MLPDYLLLALQGSENNLMSPSLLALCYSLESSLSSCLLEPYWFISEQEHFLGIFISAALDKCFPYKL